VDWGEILGKAVEGLVGTAAFTILVNNWMKIGDPSTLKYTIRNDIRDLSVKDVKMIESALKSMINNSQSDARNRAMMVKEILIEEAERKWP
jgi:hypothetical protein